VNANELADEMMKFYNLEENTAPIQIYDLVATMLRQQQEEIKDLKQQVAFLEDWRDTWRPFLKAITGKVNDERK
jgi:hypothetical protein